MYQIDIYILMFFLMWCFSELRLSVISIMAVLDVDWTKMKIMHLCFQDRLPPKE
jgi:hypothetical protein